MYQAIIYFDSYEDNFTEGETSKCDNFWHEILEAKTKKQLKTLIETYTFSEWKNVTQDNINDYPTKTEYWASYMADADNYEATESELRLWKQGKLRLWAIHCHILVTELAEKKVLL